ncbi:uncharacterized protein EV420DRAFT_108523 [Desarmillaria tabescens]|uniref:Protein-S-isoprenylcysteine O-methyltransferase n=1 Tax=Armillaria tabescens TaxID=1929756 RepID=A0AA39NR60_ARMTA|nr:uncharacterized protein EV420DRAFT_108523 [Desarmillaria tabescens]KAK0470347.1 hypothetical protein EV420DRAFT_108523 [Desarmillaria tabescens]
MNTSLLRLPFLLSATYGVHKSMTPPHLAPAEEQLPIKGFDVERAAPAFAIFAKATFYFLCATETAAILSTNDLLPTQYIPLHLLPSLNHTIQLTKPYLFFWICTILGSSLRVYCYRIMSSFFTFELSIRKDHKLITHGPYSIVRHPSYVGAMLCGIGAVGSHLSRGSWLSNWINTTPIGWLSAWAFTMALVRIALVPRMNKEDNMLKDAFGKEWENWTWRVPYRLIPWVY